MPFSQQLLDIDGILCHRTTVSGPGGSILSTVRYIASKLAALKGAC
jgi:hypothetical protein